MAPPYASGVPTNRRYFDSSFQSLSQHAGAKRGCQADATAQNLPTRTVASRLTTDRDAGVSLIQ